MSFTVGDRVELSRAFAPADLDEYHALTGVPPRSDGAVPPALVGALISCLLGTRLPGLGTNWLKQRLSFARNARLGERLTASVEVVRLRPDKQLIDLRTLCTDASGHPICDGAALVLLKETP
jgi:3-hydroxybutyryl-CoA dehydratase